MTTSRRTSPTREVGRVADRLHSAAIHLLRRLRVDDEALGISAPRLSALSVLVFAGPKRIGELARIEQVEPPTMTRLVDGLVRNGLAVRETDPDDARAVRVRATATGGRTLRRGRARRVETLRASLAGLSPADLAALGEGVEVLERILRDR
ncbi:MAG TPA: MarR family transcriptional regulator [Actinomycetota bacterium]|nr:MarR family transcriptional regulator [Actinomycetota bacterium]